MGYTHPSWPETSWNVSTFEKTYLSHSLPRHRRHLHLSLEQGAAVCYGLVIINKHAHDEIYGLHIPFAGIGEEFDTMRFVWEGLDSSSESATIFRFLRTCCTTCIRVRLEIKKTSEIVSHHTPSMCWTLRIFASFRNHIHINRVTCRRCTTSTGRSRTSSYRRYKNSFVKCFGFWSTRFIRITGRVSVDIGFSIDGKFIFTRSIWFWVRIRRDDWCLWEERCQAFLFQCIFALVFWRHRSSAEEDEEGSKTRWVVFGRCPNECHVSAQF